MIPLPSCVRDTERLRSSFADCVQLTRIGITASIHSWDTRLHIWDTGLNRKTVGLHIEIRMTRGDLAWDFADVLSEGGG